MGANSKIRFELKPIRRVLALDAGSRRIKLLLAQKRFGKLSILRQEMIDLQAEGLVAAEELKAHLQETLADFAHPPLAMALPQHLSTSQVIELPHGPDAEVEKLIHDETHKLSGVSESRIVYDFVRAGARGNRQQFWVTLSQEREIKDRCERLGVDQEDICEITTTASALLAAFRHAAPQLRNSIIVHLAAQSTIILIMAEGQGVFAANFPMGGDFFTRSLARGQGMPEEQAETLKQSANFFEGTSASPSFITVADGWCTEVRRQVEEWFADNQRFGGNLQDWPVFASGGGFQLLGLRDHAEKLLGVEIHPWPTSQDPAAPQPAAGFEVAFGTALQALGLNDQAVSLLPEDYQAAWKKRAARQQLEVASSLLLAVCFALLLFGTWRQASIMSRKDVLLAKYQAASEAVDLNNILSAELVNGYEALRPVSALQQNTIDTLGMLSIVWEIHTNQSYWYVLLADQSTYFAPGPFFVLATTNSSTNAVSSLGERRRVSGWESLGLAPGTNVSAARPGYIAEVCIPGEAEASRAILSRLVTKLKDQKLFSKVDLLSEDLRQNLADPKVLIPDRHFALALDFANSDFQQAVRPRRPTGLLPVRPGTPRRTNSPGNPRMESNPYY